MVNKSKVVVQYFNQFTEAWVDFISVGSVDPKKAYDESKRWFPHAPVRIIHRVIEEKVIYDET